MSAASRPDTYFEDSRSSLARWGPMTQGQDDGQTVPGDQAELDVRIAKFGVLVGDDAVREQGDHQAQPGGRPVDLGDDRLFDLQHRMHKVPAPSMDPMVGCRTETGDVGTAAKAVTRSGQHDHLRGGLEIGPGQHRHELDHHGRLHGVEPFRTVERHRAHPASVLHENGLCFIGGHLFEASSRGGRSSRGSPSTCSASVLRWISDVPARMVQAR